MLETPYILKGNITHGKALGRTVGMPTANLCVTEGIIPKAGVYATRIKVSDEWFLAVTNIGNRPTVDEKQDVTIESFILDFERDIYGEDVILEVLEYLRPIQKFSGLDAVFAQVKKDAEKAKKCLTQKNQSNII